jgi:hypothetical protein
MKTQNKFLIVAIFAVVIISVVVASVLIYKHEVGALIFYASMVPVFALAIVHEYFRLASLDDYLGKLEKCYCKIDN